MLNPQGPGLPVPGFRVQSWNHDILHPPRHSLWRRCPLPLPVQQLSKAQNIQCSCTANKHALAGLQENWINQNHQRPKCLQTPKPTSWCKMLHRCFNNSGLGIFILDPTSLINSSSRLKLAKQTMSSWLKLLVFAHLHAPYQEYLLPHWQSAPCKFLQRPRFMLSPSVTETSSHPHKDFLMQWVTQATEFSKVHRSSNNTAHFLASQSFGVFHLLPI